MPESGPLRDLDGWSSSGGFNTAVLIVRLNFQTVERVAAYRGYECGRNGGEFRAWQCDHTDQRRGDQGLTQERRDRDRHGPEHRPVATRRIGFTAANIAAVVGGAEGAVVKLILMNAYPMDEQKVAVCRAVDAADADHMKASTAFAPSGATLKERQLMRASVSERVNVRAAGRARAHLVLAEMTKWALIGAVRPQQRRSWISVVPGARTHPTWAARGNGRRQADCLAVAMLPSHSREDIDEPHESDHQ